MESLCGLLVFHTEGERMNSIGVVILRSNPISPDPRVEKEARALHRAGYKVRLVGWDRLAAFPQLEERDYGIVERIHLRAAFGSGVRNLPHLVRWQARLLLWLWRNRSLYEVVHACDFDTVLPALVAKGFWRKRVVYDVFDFYADMVRGIPTPIRALIRTLDLFVMGKVDSVILPDEGRREQIKGARPRRLELIYNTPESLVLPEAKERKGDELRIVYVGVLQFDRGITEMLTVLKHHPEWQFDLAGFGADEDSILAVARKLPNVHIHGRISYEKALQLSSFADVLFATYDPRIPNNRYSSANKLFEAMMLGKPIIVARGTGMDRLVEKHGLGFVIDYGAIEQIEAALLEVSKWLPEKREEFSRHARSIYATHFPWQQMEQRLIRLYRTICRP